MKVLVCDWREKTHILCIFREDDVAEAEFAEFKTEWDRLVGLHPGGSIYHSVQSERVWVDNLCITSKLTPGLSAGLSGFGYLRNTFFV